MNEGQAIEIISSNLSVVEYTGIFLGCMVLGIITNIIYCALKKDKTK